MGSPSIGLDLSFFCLSPAILLGHVGADKRRLAGLLGKALLGGGLQGRETTCHKDVRQIRSYESSNARKADSLCKLSVKDRSRVCLVQI